LRQEGVTDAGKVQEADYEEGPRAAQEQVLLDSVGSRRVLDVVREEIGSRESEGDSRDGEEAVAGLHLEDDESGRDDQDQEADDRGADDLSAEEPQGDETRRGGRQEAGTV